jgi:hypothetical protein
VKIAFHEELYHKPEYVVGIVYRNREGRHINLPAVQGQRVSARESDVLFQSYSDERGRGQTDI